MPDVDLTTLEYPRHVHGQPWQTAFLVVRTADECAAALDAGWTLDCVIDPPTPAEPEIEMSKKRGRPRKVQP